MTDPAGVSSAPPALHPNVTRETPFPARLWAYAEERFPPGPMATVTVVTVVSASCAAGAAWGGRPVWDLGLLLLALSYGLLVFLLRLLDEHKDFAKDRTAYPERLLSRGVITLPELARVAWLCAGLGLAAAAALGPRPLAAYAVLLVYALLMEREFFLGPLLHKDVFLYAAAHQPINPLLTGYLLVGYGSQTGAPLAWPPAGWGTAIWTYVLSLALLGFGFEVARKLWTPEEERPDLVDSYSSHAIGPRGAGLLALVLVLGGCGVLSAAAAALELPVWVHVGPGLCALLTLPSLGRFAWRPYPGASKPIQGAVGLGLLLTHLVFVAAVLAGRGGPSWAIWAGGGW